MMIGWWFLWPLLVLFLFWGIGSTWWPRGRSYGYGWSDAWGDEPRPFPAQRALWRSRARASSNRGRGPAGYRRSDERITEDVNDALMVSEDLDASGVTVSVAYGVVVLSGFVHTRTDKRLAEALADSVAGVTDVKNELRIGAAPPSQSLPASMGQPESAEPHPAS